MKGKITWSFQMMQNKACDKIQQLFIMKTLNKP